MLEMGVDSHLCFQKGPSIIACFPPRSKTKMAEDERFSYGGPSGVECGHVRKLEESSCYSCFIEGEKCGIFCFKTPACDANKILLPEDGKTICQSSYSASATKDQSKSSSVLDLAEHPR